MNAQKPRKYPRRWLRISRLKQYRLSTQCLEGNYGATCQVCSTAIQMPNGKEREESHARESRFVHRMVDAGEPSLRRRRGCVFSLVELLVTIAIIAILSALLFSALGKAKGMATGIACINNLKQIGLAQAAYSMDCNDWIVPAKNTSPNWIFWINLLSGKDFDGSNFDSGYGVSYYGKNQTRGTLACPSEAVGFGNNVDGKYSYTHYSINGWLTGTPSGVVWLNKYRRLNAITNAAAAIFAFDNKMGTSPIGTTIRSLAYRHGQGDPRPIDPTVSLPSNPSRAHFLHMDGHVMGLSYCDFLILDPGYAPPVTGRNMFYVGFNAYNCVDAN